MAVLISLIIVGAIIFILTPKGAKKPPQAPRRPNIPLNSAPPAQGPAKRYGDELEAEIHARIAARETTIVATPSVPPVVVTPPKSAAPSSNLPDSLPLKTKAWFFSRSEAGFFSLLEEALPAGYRVFPNVRLNDLFYITTKDYAAKQSVLGRLRDKHTDFLIVSLPEYKPVMAIELDGASHDNDKQQHRDATKDLAFRSAGLRLVRLRTETAHTVESVRAVLQGGGVR